MSWPQRFVSLAAVLMVSATACAAVPAEQTRPPAEYLQWLDGLKEEMIARGISRQTVDEVYKTNYYKPNQTVVKIDRKQNEFVLTSTQYLNRAVSQKRVEKARQHYKQLYPRLKKISDKYGVQPHYIIAFWAIETNFGQNFGGYDVIDALTTLSYDRRRPKFFKEELYQALKIIDTWHIDHTKMQGSWAGAMGHFQFMPSTINAYAVDYNGDGSIDIWHSFEDAAASAANYLHQIGWDKNQEWGMPVTLPWNFDFANSGRKNIKTVKEWKKLGVKTLSHKKLNLPDDLKAAIIVPEGKKGSAYLVLNNFRKIMIWNRSENYALAIGLLADYLRTGRSWKPVAENPAVRLKTDDILKIQAFINKLGFGKLDEDGMLGAQTREAIKQVQQKAKLPQDGYPDASLLNKINNYNPEIGFAIPVPPRKLHKGS